MRRIIVLSGPVESGKTTIANKLKDLHGFLLIKSTALIKKRLNTLPDRISFQEAGERLDRRTRGRWIKDDLVRILGGLTEDREDIVIDSVRIAAQVEYIREAYPVIHIHLTAPLKVLSRRYAVIDSDLKEAQSYSTVTRNVTESKVEQLKDIADIVINTERCNAEDVYVQVASRLGLYGRAAERVVDVMIGGQYGSEGKGHVASYLAPNYDILVRVGGPNAGHTVYGNPPYTHHHLPSGTRFCNSKIILGPGSILSTDKLLKEIAECQVETDRLYIDPQAMIIDEKDIKHENKTLKQSIGSTAQGVGAAKARKVLRNSAKPPVKLAKDVVSLKHYIKETRIILDDAFAKGQRIFLEGTQGTGLSLHHGYYPYVTSRDTSVSGCLSEAGIAPSRVRKIIMVCRTYPIRVESPAKGTSGPMGGEISWSDVSKRSGIPLPELQKAEKTSTTNRDRRVAEFDWALLRKAASLNGPTDIALTFADYISIENRKARRFNQLTPETIHFIEEIERVSAAPVALITTRFHHRSVIDRRTWS